MRGPALAALAGAFAAAALAAPALAADKTTPAKLLPFTYPVLSLAEGEQGTSRVRITVGADGKANACTVTKSSGFARLDEAACHALTTRATYQAATRNGAPVPWYIDTAITFSPEAPPQVAPAPKN